MRIPKEIREKVELRNKLNKEIRAWFKETDEDLDGMDTNDAYICDIPTGTPQSDGAYCYQRFIIEDVFEGVYYWKCDNGQYLAIDFCDFWT